MSYLPYLRTGSDAPDHSSSPSPQPTPEPSPDPSPDPSQETLSLYSLFELHYGSQSDMPKKRRGPTLEEILDRPWCYYCERDFDDLKILINHQKAKHFKCEKCARRLNTAGGLTVHVSQVHKEHLTEVDNALPNRKGLDLEIFGMEGIPDDVIRAHKHRLATQFQKEEMDRQAVTGNPPAGSSASNRPSKKPKHESSSDIKKRLAEFKAKRAAQALAGDTSSDVTPNSATATPVAAQSAQSTPTLGYAQPAQPAAIASQPYTYPQPYGGSAAAAPPFLQTASPGYSTYSPFAGPSFPGSSPFMPTGYPQHNSQVVPPSFLPQPTPPENRSMGLPAVSSLPQRPAFAAPAVNAHQMQQMHMGHQVSTPTTPGYPNDLSPLAPLQAPVEGDAQTITETATTKKPAEMEKAPPRMIYCHETLCPEERMAQLPRYAWNPDRTTETVLGDVPSSVVVGAIQDSDTVLDPAH